MLLGMTSHVCGHTVASVLITSALTLFLLYCCCCPLCWSVWLGFVRSSNKYKLISTSKAASLLLNSVVCHVLTGDVVKGKETFRKAVRQDPQVRTLQYVIRRYSSCCRICIRKEVERRTPLQVAYCGVCLLSDMGDSRGGAGFKCP